MLVLLCPLSPGDTDGIVLVGDCDIDLVDVDVKTFVGIMVFAMVFGMISTMASLSFPPGGLLESTRFLFKFAKFE